jgi:hypothetical protein
MSNRTLIEINHDLWHMIKERPQAFTEALICYLGSAGPRTIEPLGHFGIRVFGMRHHSEMFEIMWGVHRAAESGRQCAPEPSTKDTLLARLAVRTLDYVGRDRIEPKMNCDLAMQAIALEAEEMLGGTQRCAEIAVHTDPQNRDGRTVRRKRSKR